MVLCARAPVPRRTLHPPFSGTWKKEGLIGILARLATCGPVAETQFLVDSLHLNHNSQA